MEHSDVSSGVNDATERGDWREVGHLMESGQLSEEQRSQVVEAASQCAGEQDLAAFIVPVLTEGELLRVLKTLFTRRLWSAVCQVLEKRVSNTLSIHILTEALHLDDDHVLLEHILPMCDSGQVDLFMTHLATTGQWSYVLRLLGFVGHLRSTWRVGDIQIDGTLFKLVAFGDWAGVGAMLGGGISDPQRRWAISVACQRANGWKMIDDILPHCTDDQFEDVLTVLVRRRLWPPVGTLLGRAWSPAQHRWAIRKACQQADDWSVVGFILPRCPDHQLDDVLTTIVTQKLWRSVDMVLHRIVSPAQHRWAIREACQQADHWSIKDFILPHCAKHQLDDVLTTVVTRELWRSVGMVLHRIVSPAQHRWAIREACQQADHWSIVGFILPHCADHQLDDVLTTVVTRELWRSVDMVLHRIVSPAQHRWAVHQACQKANEEDFRKHILPHSAVDIANCTLLRCVDDQCDDAVVKLVARGQWICVDRVLHRIVSPATHRWAVQEACLQAEEEDIIRHILSHCAESQLEEVLTVLITRRFWRCVDLVLQRSVNPLQKRRAKHQAQHQAGNMELVIPGTLDLTMYEGRMLRHGVSATKHKSAIQEACQWANDEDICHYILPHCADDQLEDIMPTLVTRCLWWSVDQVLHRAVSPTKHRQTVQEAVQGAGDGAIVNYILPHCADDQLEDVLTILVTQGMWQSVKSVLLRGVSPANHRRTVQEACQRADEEDIREYFLPHCADDQLDDVLTTLVIRGLWGIVDRVFLHLGDRSVQHFQDVRVFGHHDKDQYIRDCILPHCADSRLEDVLTSLVAGGLWRSADRVLDRGVSPAKLRWAIHEACQQADDQTFTQYMLLRCADDQLDDVLTTLVTRGLWWSASHVVERGVNPQRHRWAVQEVLKSGNDLFITGCIVPGCRPKEFWNTYLDNDLCDRKAAPRPAQMWKHLARQLFRLIRETLYSWAVAEDTAQTDDATFWRYVVNPHYDMKDLSQLLIAVRPLRQQAADRLAGGLGWEPALCAVLCESVVHFVTETWVSGQTHDTQRPAGQLDEEAKLLTTQIQEQILEGQSRSTPHISHTLRAVRTLCSAGTADTDRRSPVFGLYFIKNLTQHCYRRRQATTSTDVILHVLSCVPVVWVPDVQSVALIVMLRHKRWDIIRRADLRGVWEQVRRRLLTAAIKQEQWSLVAQWANYTLYDDQCLDALEEAYTHKQWRVYLLLADHGPTELDLMRVHYRLTRYAPWDVVLEMFERGADLIECQEGVRPGKNLRILDQEKDDNERRPRYVKLLLLQEQWEERIEELGSLEAALEKQEWSVALHEVNRRHRREEIVLALRAALTSNVWHVVIYLIRQGIGTRLCDRLFSLMVSKWRWDVCRVLLEEGVDPQLALDALPQLMEQNQWTLVARLMEYDVGDALRRQVMQQALDRREGSVVWQCIINMEHDHLCVEERQELFHEAFNRENWQAVKPLVEMKDDTGIQHRDAALLESIEQHQWDVVDHCLLFRANINMLDEDRHTPMHRMARKDDWEAVEELTKRGGDPNSLDIDGVSVFHRVIWARQWELAKLLIEYHGDIHQHADWADMERRTPLQILIDDRQMEVIKHTFMWCPDQGKGVNDEGETTLHAACLTGCIIMLYDVLARRVDPRAVTRRGHSALCYAVMCRDTPQETVAECIRFGFSTHQPQLTDHRQEHADSEPDSTDSSMDSDSEDNELAYPMEHQWSTVSPHTVRLLSSPLLLAVMRGLPVVARMLFESGACSYRELFRLQTPLVELVYAEPSEKTMSERVVQEILNGVYDQPNVQSFEHVPTDEPPKPDRDCVQQCAWYVMQVSSSPRSLRSLCSHVISHCIKLHKNYAEDVNELPLVGAMKRCVGLCDLTEPDYGQDDVYRQRREEFVSRHLSEALSLLAEGGGPSVDTDTGPQVDTGTPREGEEEEESDTGGEGGGPSVDTDTGPQVVTGTPREEEEGHTDGGDDEDEEDDDSEVDSEEYSYNIYDMDSDEED